MMGRAGGRERASEGGRERETGIGGRQGGGGSALKKVFGVAVTGLGNKRAAIVSRVWRGKEND